jgi:hypothetical protein
MREDLREQATKQAKRCGQDTAPPLSTSLALDGRSGISPLYSALTGSIRVEALAGYCRPDGRQGTKEERRSVARRLLLSSTSGHLVNLIPRSMPPPHPSERFVKPRRISR